MRAQAETGLVYILKNGLDIFKLICDRKNRPIKMWVSEAAGQEGLAREAYRGVVFTKTKQSTISNTEPELIVKQQTLSQFPIILKAKTV